MQVTYRHRDQCLTLDVQCTGKGAFRIRVGEQVHEVEAELIRPNLLRLIVDGLAYTLPFVRNGQTYHVAVDGEVYALTAESAAPAEHAVLASPRISAPMPGKVLQVLVQEGQEVAAGDGLLVLEAMKMENRIVAEAPGVVRKLHVQEGQMVEGGTVMIELEYRH